MKRTPKKRMDYTGWTEEQHAEHLKTHPPYLEYYTKFSSTSIEYFIESYASQKLNMFEKRDDYEEAYETHQTQFLTDAERFIDAILQKKLFNLQCQWRAGLINLPLVETSEDFFHWAKEIRQCPFIPPITPDELELCMNYLKEELDFSDVEIYQQSEWQDYAKMKNQMLVDEYEENKEEDDNDEEEDDDLKTELFKPYQCQIYPDIYRFFDTFQNTANLLRLPDIRGEKEKIYKEEGYRIEKQKEEDELKAKGEWKEPEPGEPYVHRPLLYPHSDLPDFVEAVEDDATKEVFKAYSFVQRIGTYSKECDEEIDECIEFLRSFEEEIPIEASSDWESAILLTVRKFKQLKTLEMLPYAYETYMLEFDDDVPFEQIMAERVSRYHYDYKAQKDYLYESRLRSKRYILDGREALDGVRDFNY